MRQVTSVNWSFIGDAVPAFITIITMPFSYSVAYGLIAGLFTYTILNSLIFVTKFVSRGAIEPPDADLKEYWTIRPGGGQLPWFLRVRDAKKWFGGVGVYVVAEERGEGRSGSVATARDGSLGEASEKELVEGVAR